MLHPQPAVHRLPAAGAIHIQHDKGPTEHLLHKQQHSTNAGSQPQQGVPFTDFLLKAGLLTWE